jgi:peptidoglycan/xylan/chitin deacetylase (PgdA/CDA1 family)
MIPTVLCYHKIERRRELGVTRLSPRHFARQVSALARAGWSGISLADFTATIRGERAAGRKDLLITFDDAYRGLRDHAFPILRGVGFHATCFVITDYAGKLNRWDVAYGGRRFAHLAWRDIERWSEEGISFESHTATHPRLSWLGPDRIVDELVRSRQALASALGSAPTAIAYPFGAVNAVVTRAAHRAGYELGFGVGGRWRGDPFTIPRVAVHAWSPSLPAVGALGPLERAASTIAGRCSVGTSLWREMTRAVS